MPRFSVKKPLTVFVAVVAIIALGVVSFLKMTPDLLPNMDFPYVIIMTSYPGASPEKVEREITRPMEQAMSTLEHIKEVTSTSSENVSTVTLEFEDQTNMDTMAVDIQQKLSALTAGWEDTVGAPYVLKMNPSMLPVEVAAVSMEGMDTMELTDFLNDTLLTKLEGIPGVAQISSTGMVQQQVHVVLDQKKIDALNEKIAAAVNDQMDDAKAELEEQKDDVEKARNQLNAAKNQMGAGAIDMDGIQSQIGDMVQYQASVRENYAALSALQQSLNAALEQKAAAEAAGAQIPGLQARIAEIQAAMAATEDPEELAALEAELNQVTAQLEEAAQIYGTLPMIEQTLAGIDQSLAALGTDRENLSWSLSVAQENLDDANAQLDGMMDSAQNAVGMIGKLGQAQAEMAVGSANLNQALTQIESGLDSLEEGRENALKQADLNGIITMDMVSKLLAAQNFSMPAGFVEEDGIQYMVSVGDEIQDLETLENLLLFDLNMEGVDPITLKDVAVVSLTDNRADTYAKLNGLDSVMLSFQKQSTYATAEATDNILSRFDSLEQEFPGLKFVSLMNQGDYIYLIVNSILNSLLLGAVFAIAILFLFLRDLRPTFVTLCSIPLSVVFAIVLMYFSGVTINMISLSGLAVSVGMLVDNTVVVIENIYRLRSKGANAIQAAVSGAGQVAGAVTASTLTTVCVFLPIVFVEGITRQLFTDLALTMTYALMASLIVSLTLVPAMASGMLVKDKPIKQGVLETKLLPLYEKAAYWSLDHKAVIILGAVVLLAAASVGALARGFIYMPQTDMSTVNLTITMPEDTDMETAVKLSDEVLNRIGTLEGIDTVGAMMGGGMLGGSGGNTVTVYVNLADKNASGAALGREIEALCQDLPCTVSTSSSMMDMSALTGSGVSMELYAEDMDTLQAAAKKSAEILEGIEGLGEVSDGLEDAAPAYHVAIDQNAAMRHGLTVAQIYMELAAGLTKDTTTATLELDGVHTDLIIEKPDGAVLDGQGLKNHVFTVTDKEGNEKQVPLRAFALVRETSSLSSIRRLNQRRYLTVTAAVEEGHNVTILTKQARQAMENADLGEGVSFRFAGENENIMDSMKQLGIMLALGILLVYLVMVAQFQSLKSPFIVMFTIPLAFTGGFLALLICGMEVSVISLIGFIMLTGVIVNNGIVLVDYMNTLRREGKPRRQAIVEAGVTRMRPILMTTITTILGLIDMAVRKSAGTAMMQPVAVVCIGGLTYATLMTLFVVPCIYDAFNKKDLRTVSDEDLNMLDL